MKQIVLLLLGLGFLVAGVSGYQIFINAPDNLSVGLPLVVNGTTNYGIGTPLDIVLYLQITTSNEIDRHTVYVMSDNTFSTVFDTSGLRPGPYKVSVLATGASDSLVSRQVTIIDRTGEISLTSSTTQPVDNAIHLAGNMANDAGTGVQITVTGAGNGVLFGPSYVGTDKYGGFVLNVPVNQPGDYLVTFADPLGFIGTKTIHVTSETGTMPVTPFTTTASQTAVSETLTNLPNPATTTTASPLPAITGIIGIGCAAIIVQLRRH